MEIQSARVRLRDQLPSDVEARLRWVTTETVWAEWDAPWDEMTPVAPERFATVREKIAVAIAQPPPTPRTQLYIELIGGPLLGWVNQYHEDARNRTTLVGMNLCESEFWNRGLGTEALKLWVGHLFGSQDLHRVGLETWSGNARMMRVADKLGFVLEGRLRENVELRGRRYDSLKYGVLRREWFARRDQEESR